MAAGTALATGALARTRVGRTLALVALVALACSSPGAAPGGSANSAAPTATAAVSVPRPSAPTAGAPALIPDKLTVAHLPVNEQTPLYAGALGTWRSEGLEVETEILRGGPAIVEAMLAGQIVAAQVGLFPGLNLATRGAPMIFLAMNGFTSQEYPLFPILTLSDSQIYQFGDLRGRSLAVNQFGNVEDNLLYAAGRHYGLPRSDIDVIQIPYPNMPQALRSRQVDVIYTAPPTEAAAEIQANARVVIDSSDFLPYLPIAGLLVSQRWAEGNPEATKRLIKGWARANRWIDDNPQEARQVAARVMDLDAAIAAKMRMAYFARNPYVMLPAVWNMYYLMVENKTLEPVADPQAMFQRYFIDPMLRYTQPALQELGLEPDPVAERYLHTPLPYLPGPLENYLGPWER